jgi:hypothetical protein
MGLFDITERERAEFARMDAQEKEQQQRAAEYEAELQRKYDSLESVFVPLLKSELEAENASTRVTDRTRADFGKFQAFCKEAGYPSLPAAPQAVAEFLGSQIQYGPAYVTRLRNAISNIHTAVLGNEDPCADILVRALMRLAKQDKDSSPQQKDAH